MDEGAPEGDPGLLFEKMGKFITTIDELRDYGLTPFVSLPRIAVLGLQSSGKSSLLESIAGYDFLPRGEGIVTRRPLELRLVHAAEVERPVAVFEENPAERLTDFNVVRQRIVEYTDKAAGTRKGIIDRPLLLTITARSCPDLTLVDLPGITKIPVRNSDHTENIEELTTNLAVGYIRDPRTIILCVVQANVDISVSDAIKIAQRHDRSGERTLCALTKVDQMDKSNSLRATVNNEEVPLRYGYIAVKNRSAEDTRRGVPVVRGLEEESAYFLAHYPDLVEKGVAGSRCLINKLSLILAKNIQHAMPEITRELNEKIESFEGELRALGSPLPEAGGEKLQLVINLITQFSQAYADSIRVKYTKGKKADRDPVGVPIRKLFLDVFEEHRVEEIERLLTDRQIKAIFVNYGASSLPGFPPYSAFQKLLDPLLRRLVPNTADLVDRVYFLLERNVNELVDRIFLRFPETKTLILDMAMKNLANCKRECEALANDYLEAELGYLYTCDEKYLALHGSILPSAAARGANTSMGDAFVREVRDRIRDYFVLVFRNLRDSIPKCIGSMLLNESCQRMNIELIEGINRNSENIVNTLLEPEIIVLQRKQCSSALKVLKKCLKKLQDEDIIELNSAL